jgi:hypothetical protein
MKKLYYCYWYWHLVGKTNAEVDTQNVFSPTHENIMYGIFDGNA